MKRFIFEVTGEIMGPSDDRTTNLFKKQAKRDKDLLYREEFIEFYRSASATGSGDAVFQNMENMLFRADMK